MLSKSNLPASASSCEDLSVCPPPPRQFADFALGKVQVQPVAKCRFSAWQSADWW